MLFKERVKARHALVTTLLIALVAVIVSGNVIGNGFVYDDEYQILKNPWITSFTHIPAVFSSELWGYRGDSVSNYYRPLMHVVYMACYRLFGFHAWGYHLVSLLLHAAVSVLVFAVASSFLAREDGVFRRFAPAVAALLFAVHPIHAEVVAPAMSVTDLLLSLFYLSALLLHMKFQERPWYYNLVPAVLFLCALLSKEIAVTLPVLLLACDWVYGSSYTPGERVRRLAPYAVVGIVYLLVRSSVLGAFTPIDRHPELTPFLCLINVFPLAVQYAVKLIVPVQLNAMYEFRPVLGLWEWRTLASLLLCAGGASMLFKVARRDRVVLFGCLLLLLPLLPAFYIRAIPYPFAERYLYLPSAGFALLVAVAVNRSLQRESLAVAVRGALCCVCCVFAVATWERNTVWHDNLALWSDTVTKSPKNAIVHANLGEALKSEGRVGEAIAELKAAVALDPASDFLRILGSLYYDSGNRPEALRCYLEAIRREGGNWMAHSDLGCLYGEMGDLPKAIEHLEDAVRLQPKAAQIHYNLGTAYRDAGLPDKSIEELSAAAALSPEDGSYRQALAQVMAGRSSHGGGAQ